MGRSGVLVCYRHIHEHQVRLVCRVVYGVGDFLSKINQNVIDKVVLHVF